MESVEKNLNALMAVLISCVLLGAFGIQIFKHEEPCSLCLLQRLGMLGVAAGALMNVKFGIQKAHYGLSILSALSGAFVSLRQIALHICPDFKQWGSPFWGLSLYTWAFIVFTSSLGFIGLLLLIFDKNRIVDTIKSVNVWGLFAFALVFIAAVGNVFVSFWICGLGPCE